MILRLSHSQELARMLETEGEGRLVGVTPIDVSREDLDSLKAFIKSSKASDWVWDNRTKKLVGSWCTLCGGIPTKIASYDYNGAVRIERYCDECAEKQFSHIVMESEDFEWPKCTIGWCTTNLPGIRYIPIRPDSPNIRHRVCENCYYDYEFEGIYTYSYTGEQMGLRNMSPEERFKLWSKLDKLNWDPDWQGR
jgi:hypothetical protein